MPPRARKIAVILGAAAIATGAGVGVVSQSGTAATNTTAGAQHAAGGPAGRLDVAALATQLGVTQSKLQAALDASRPGGGQGGPPPSGSQQPPTGGQPPAGGGNRIASGLAHQLGMSTSKVQAALDAVRGAGS
jgi:hypothetical protein